MRSIISLLFLVIHQTSGQDNPGGWITPLYGDDISDECLDASNTYLENVNGTSWALQMLDSNGRLPMEGFLASIIPVKLDLCNILAAQFENCANVVPASVREIVLNIPIGFAQSPGSYEGCLAVDSYQGFAGKYCTIEIKTPKVITDALYGARIGGGPMKDAGIGGGPMREHRIEFPDYIQSLRWEKREFLSNFLNMHIDILKHRRHKIDTDNNEENQPIVSPEQFLSNIQDIYKTYVREDNDTTTIPTQEQVAGIILGVYAALNSPTIGMCFPSTCSSEEIVSNYKHMLEPFAVIEDNADGTQSFVTEELKCYTDQGRNASRDPIPHINIFLYTVFAFIGLFILLGTALDLYPIIIQSEKLPLDTKTPDSLTVKLIKSFSLHSNGIALLNTNTGGSGHLDCLNGMRFISMTWVVLGHVFFMVMDANFRNKLTTALDISSGGYGMAYEAILNAMPSVDSFYFMGGTVTAYVFFKELDKAGDNIQKHVVTFIMYYVHRYLRLTITYALIMGVVIAVFPYVYYGPAWYMIIEEANMCKKYWWQHLLYIHTLFPSNRDDCMMVTWYLVPDMIFHWFSPIVFYPMYILRKKTSGQHTASVTYWAVVTATFTSYVCYLNYSTRKSPSAAGGDWVGGTTEQPNGVSMYFSPWNRYQPYLVGIILGYALHHLRGKEVKINLLVNLVMWQIAFLSAFAVVYGLYDNRVAGEMSLLSSTIYNTFQRLAYAGALAWVVFACVKGYGGVINHFLSWSLFSPLSRLTFCCYLTHIQIIWMTGYSVFSTFSSDINNWTIVMLIISFVALSLCVSAIFVLAFEFPFSRVERILIGKLITLILPSPTVNKKIVQENGTLKDVNITNKAK